MKSRQHDKIVPENTECEGNVMACPCKEATESKRDDHNRVCNLRDFMSVILDILQNRTHAGYNSIWRANLCSYFSLRS